MLMSLTPVVYGGKRWRWLVGAFLHVLGGLMGGTLVGLALAPLSLVPIPPQFWIALGALAAVALLGDLGVTRRLYPTSRRQVPERWRKFLPPDTVFFLYGLGLGTAFSTRIRSAALFAAVAFALATSEPVLVIATLAMFGAARAISAVAPTASLYPQERAIAFADRIGGASATAATIAAATAALISGWVLGGSV